MKQKFSRNHSLRVVLPFSAILILLITAAALAQTSGAGHKTARANAVLAPAGTSARPKDGNSLFGPVVTYSDSGLPYSVAAGDFNGDGKLDLALLNSGTIGVLLGNGDGTFRAAVNYDSGGGAAEGGSVAIADVNNDGKLDLAVLNSDAGGPAVLLGNGDGTFGPAAGYYLGAAGGGWGGSVAFADLNADGKPDLLVDLAACATSVIVLLGNGDGTFASTECGSGQSYYSGGWGDNSITSADLNGDGRPDVIAANGEYAVSNNIGVLLGNGDGTLQPVSTYDAGGLGPLSVAVADVNGDHKPDLVVANCGLAGCPAYGLGEGSVAVLLGNGDGTFQPAVAYDSAGVGAFAVAVADVNGDGEPDLVVANAGSNNIGVLLGNGDGTFQPAVSFASGGSYPRSIVLMDVNGDGRPDVLVANFNSGTVGVLINTANTSPTTTTLASSANPGGVLRKVTYTATVTSQNGGAVTGTITFLDGGTPVATIPVANNQASYVTRYKAVGLHTMTATYSGDAKNGGSISAALLESLLDSTRTVLTTSGSPSKVLQPVTLTATVTSKFGTPPDDELVTFYGWYGLLGSVPLVGGVATYTFTPSFEAEYKMKAVYAGDAVFAPSQGGVTQNVRKYDTATALTSSPNPSQLGETVTFTATVSSGGPMPTGIVSLYKGCREVTSSALVNGVATMTVSNLKPGKHTFYATYWSDDYNHESRSPYLKQFVQR